MKTTVYFNDFIDAFRTMGRADQFSRQGLGVLFEYLTEYEKSTGEEIELDVIALCCDYYEDNYQTIADNYSIDLTDCEDDDEKIDTVRNYLEYNTVVVGEPFEGVFVYGAF